MLHKYTVLNVRDDYAQQKYLFDISIAPDNGPWKQVTSFDMSNETVALIANHMPVPAECKVVSLRLRPRDGYIVVFELDPTLNFSANVFMNDGTDMLKENPIDAGVYVSYVTFDLELVETAPAEEKDDRLGRAVSAAAGFLVGRVIS